MTPKEQLIYRLNVKKNEVGGPQSRFFQDMVDLAREIVEAPSDVQQPNGAVLPQIVSHNGKDVHATTELNLVAGTDHEA